MQVTIDARHTFLKKNKISLQPFIIAVGTLNDINHCFVIFDSAKYRFESVVMAVDFALKLHFVLNLSYSPFCIQIWTFIQKYFYSIKTKYDLTFTSVTSALSDLY